MTFLDARLSQRIEAGFTAVPASSTRIVTLKNGHERRNARWVQKRRMYTASLASFNEAEREQLLAAIHACEGALYSFRFKDWSDYRVVGGSLGNAPAGSADVQLVKTYTFGRTHTRTITKPVAGTVTVYQDGTPKAGSVDTDTGLFTPDTAWTEGLPLTADFHFDVPVRFATDEPPFALPHRDVAELSVDLIEVFGE